MRVSPPKVRPGPTSGNDKDHTQLHPTPPRVVTVAFQESRLSLDLQADTTALPECTIWCPSNRVYTAFDTTSRTSG
eukprot:scaffold338_cov361-Pavlova_lutheri.AAC.29